MSNFFRAGFSEGRSLFWPQRTVRQQRNRTCVLSGASASVPRFFAEFIPEQSERLRITGLCSSLGMTNGQAGRNGVEIMWNFGGLGLYNRVKVPCAESD